MSNVPVVLVVEDDPNTAKPLCKILKIEGWLIHHVSTVAEAIQFLINTPDFVLLDLMLPDGNGETVLQIIRKNCMLCPVCVTSGVHDDHRMEMLSQLRPDYIMPKPINIESMLRMIHGVVG